MNQFKCSVCSKKFTRKYSLKLHATTHEKTRQKIPCTGCGKGYSTVFNLKVHLQSCQPTATLTPHDLEKRVPIQKETKKFECDICGRSYNRKHDLKMHILVTHVGTKGFKCFACLKAKKANKVFGRKSDLLRHIRKYHPNAEKETASVPSNLVDGMFLGYVYSIQQKLTFIANAAFTPLT